MSSESNFKDKVMQCLKENKFFAYATHDTMQGGVPDVHAIKGGVAVWLELKATSDFKDGAVRLGHPVTAQQSKTLRDMRKRGAFAGVLIEVPGGVVYVSAEELEPGNTRKFEQLSCKSLEDFIKCLSKFVTTDFVILPSP